MHAGSLTGLFADVSRRQPGAPAIEAGDSTLSYRQLGEAASALAARLAALGVRRGDLVGLQTGRTADAAIGVLGILMAGAAYVPLDPAYPAARLRMMAADAGLSVLVGDPALAAGCGFTAAQVVPASGHEPAPGWAGVPSGPDDPAYVIYTSGSTGQPKGCVVSHGNVVAMLDAALPLFDVDGRDRWSVFHSISFDFSVWELWGALATGATAVWVPEAAALSGEALTAFLAEKQITILSQVPSVFRSFVLGYQQAGRPPLAVRCVVFGGESADLDVTRAFARLVPGVRLVNMYGITEITVHATFAELGEDSTGNPIGEPLPHLTISLRDPDGQPVAGGEPGEMWIAGTGVAAGYLRRPELTAERFVAADGRRWYRSGDLARRGPGGSLEYLGRADQQVKLRGFRVELGEIEAVLRSHEAVRDAAVTVVTTPAGAQFLVACAVPAVPADIREHAGRFLPRHMVPHRYVAVPALPLTPSGKLDRAALPGLASST
ncbi:amino acid adenylation domain-containing protein [Longispora albida]|uniref:amino acid adenylation domain-containing protein n=1 Tax=Longispora albida TaxID=203523 RepID=UPI0003610D3D|nr:amino acid adenylation domain-containing protein [Longispora albida]